MLPVIALVGRPNVGKSTLFNRLTRSRDALVADFPGLTRDRQYGFGKVGPRPYIVIDTGGLGEAEGNLDELVAHQAWRAVAEADAVIFLVDGHSGLSSADQDIAERLRRADKPVYLAVNKSDRRDAELVTAEFYGLGLGQAQAISATHNRGVAQLLQAVLAALPPAVESPAVDAGEETLRLAVVGRPNVGKSTFINRLLGEDRLLTYDQPGTTRDSVAVAFQRQGRGYTLIDTAGVRRRSRIDDTIEKFSIVKTLQSIDQAHVAVLMVDARQGIVDQDASLLGMVVERGRALVIAVNKWDRLSGEKRAELRREIDRRLGFLDFAEVHFISALHGSGIMDVLDAVERAYVSATRDLPTPELTRILEDAIRVHAPPLVKGHSIKLRYAHQGGRNPPVIVVHGNRTRQIPPSYRRYLTNTFRRVLGLRGTPLRIELKSGENPYQPAKRPGRKQRSRAKGG